MLKNRYLALENFLNQKPAYYRIGALVVAILFIYLVWDFTVHPFLVRDKAHWQAEINSANSQIKTFEDQIQTIKETIKAGHAGTKLGKLETKLKKTKKNVAIFENQLIPLKKLDDVIAGMLNKDDLKLIKLSTGELTPIDIDVKNASYKIYEQSIDVVFSGTYFNTLKYLKKMEQSNWHFFWNDLNYKVEKYPLGEVEMTLTTLVRKNGDTA